MRKLKRAWPLVDDVEDNEFGILKEKRKG